MDTFSLSLSLSSIINYKYMKIIPLSVGIFHFFMPLFGNIIGINIIKIFNIVNDLVLGIILVLLGIDLLINFFKKEDITIKLSLIGVLLFSLSVSIDSFSVGIGINNITNSYYVAAFIFAIISCLFTFLGLFLGKYLNKIIGKYALLFGSFLLIILGVFYIF